MAQYIKTEEGYKPVNELAEAIPPMTPATAEADGLPGLVPAPSKGQQDMVLHGDGTWRAVEGGSGGDGNSGVLYVTLTQNPTIPTLYTPSHTSAEILEAHESGKYVFTTIEETDNDGRSASVVLSLSMCNEEAAMFEAKSVMNSNIINVIVGGDMAMYSYMSTEMEGATADQNGHPGDVPAPLAGQQNAVLTGSGEFVDILAAPAAEVGQMFVVKAVDENGIPTEMEAIDPARGEAWETIAEFTLEEAVTEIVIPTDLKGEEYALRKIMVFLNNVTNGKEGYEGNAVGSRLWIYSVNPDTILQQANTGFVRDKPVFGNPFLEESIPSGKWWLSVTEVNDGYFAHATRTPSKTNGARLISTNNIGAVIRQIKLGSANTNTNAYGAGTTVRVMGVRA